MIEVNRYNSMYLCVIANKPVIFHYFYILSHTNLYQSKKKIQNSEYKKLIKS